MGGRSLRLFPVALMLLQLTSAAELDKSAVEFTPPAKVPAGPLTPEFWLNVLYRKS